MDLKRTSRREILKGGAALAGGVTLMPGAAALGQTHDHSMGTGGTENYYPMIPAARWIEYGQRSVT